VDKINCSLYKQLYIISIGGCGVLHDEDKVINIKIVVRFLVKQKLQ